MYQEERLWGSAVAAVMKDSNGCLCLPLLYVMIYWEAYDSGRLSSSPLSACWELCNSFFNSSTLTAELSKAAICVFVLSFRIMFGVLYKCCRLPICGIMECSIKNKSVLCGWKDSLHVMCHFQRKIQSSFCPLLFVFNLALWPKMSFLLHQL